MLKHFSWAEYLSVTVVLLAAYYFVILLLFYRNDISHILARGRKGFAREDAVVPESKK